jgi:hypothetical protein
LRVGRFRNHPGPAVINLAFTGKFQVLRLYQY